MKEKVVSIMFVSILFVGGILTFALKDREVSFYERRKLMTSESIKKDFFGNLENYMSDQFPFRDSFISIDSVVSRYVFMNKEKNDTYIVGDYLIEKNYPYRNKEVDGFIEKINYINDNYLNNANSVYYSVIPDKSYFLSDKYLKMDFSELIDKLNSDINIQYIDIMGDFVLSDYYKTDIHLKQDSYFKVMDTFSKHLGFNYEILEYKKYIYNDFYGASISKAGSNVSGEEICYYSNQYIENARVNHIEYGEREVYDTFNLDKMDLYNLFLSGPSALVEIENKDAMGDKELIIFRDSFASSFAPLLIPFYKKITLLDLRYINMEMVPNYVDFEGKDVLFLYSTLIINSSNLLKVLI